MPSDKPHLKVTAADALEFGAPTQAPEKSEKKAISSRLWLVSTLIIVLGVVWYFVGGKVMTLMGEPNSSIPIIRAKDGPVKVRPENPGGLQVPEREKLVYERIQENGDTTRVERLLPGPEQPLPRPTAPQGMSIAEQGGGAVNSATENLFAGTTPPEVPGTPTRLVKPVLKPVDNVPSGADVASAERPVPPPPAPNSPVEAQALASSPVPAPPTAVAQPLKVPVATPKPVKDAVVKPTVTAPPATAGVSTSYRVQLAAARTQEKAEAEWRRLRKLHTDLLGSLALTVTRADLGATKGVFYRLRVGPLNNEASARQLCAGLAKRKVACLLVKPGK